MSKKHYYIKVFEATSEIWFAEIKNIDGIPIRLLRITPVSITDITPKDLPTCDFWTSSPPVIGIDQSPKNWWKGSTEDPADWWKK